jgi:hypothetical protein
MEPNSTSGQLPAQTQSLTAAALRSSLLDGRVWLVAINGLDSRGRLFTGGVVVEQGRIKLVGKSLMRFGKWGNVHSLILHARLRGWTVTYWCLDD